MNNKTFNHTLGREIKRVREEKGITQEELGARMNVNYQNISSYERGERCPSLFWMNRLYEALGIEAASFTEEFYRKLNTASVISPNITVISPASNNRAADKPIIPDSQISDNQISQEEV